MKSGFYKGLVLRPSRQPMISYTGTGSLKPLMSKLPSDLVLKCGCTASYVVSSMRICPPLAASCKRRALPLWRSVRRGQERQANQNNQGQPQAAAPLYCRKLHAIFNPRLDSTTKECNTVDHLRQGIFNSHIECAASRPASGEGSVIKQNT